MSTDATPTDPTTTGPQTASGRWIAADEPTPRPRAPILFSLTCRRRLPNTIDRANRYPGPSAAE